MAHQKIQSSHVSSSCGFNPIKANAGALTNFEVLDFLRSRGASTDPTRVIAAVAPSEFQVYDYLLHSSACNQTRENVNDFLCKCEKFDLAKAEKLNIINIRPSSEVEIDPIVEQCENRMGAEEVQELVKIIVEVFPPLTKPGDIDEDKTIQDQETMEAED
ncbi:hypothetical protein Scep_020274 [Stephania cephalantha]|uniref:DNA-directed RNA polymerase III subunit RPC9 n=1 Tax=Stephania cephalantha TaxID=152367 RepID=A0AAP0ICV5_9MAGN